MQTLFQYKYTIPPVLSIVAIAAAHPHESLGLLRGGDATFQILFGGTLLIFALGYVISTVTYAFLNFCTNDFDSANEWDYWTGLEPDLRAFRRSNIERRWNMAMLNFNSFGALLIAMVAVASSNVTSNDLVSQSSCWIIGWFVVTIFIAALTLLLGRRARRQVRDFTDSAKTPDKK